MRRWLAGGLAAVALIAFTACGGSGDSTATGDSTTVATTTVTASGEARGPIVAAALCTDLSPGEMRMASTVANPGDVPAVYAFTPTVTKADGSDYFAAGAAVIVPPGESVPLVSGFPTNAIEPAASDPCQFNSYSGGQWGEEGAVALSEAEVDASLLADLVRGSVNDMSCSDDQRAQCAHIVECVASGRLAGRCDIELVGGGTRGEVGARRMVWDVEYSENDGEFTYTYIQ
jgi:hypothetical protein